MAQEMGIDGAVEDREAQLRDENIFHLLPDFGRVGHFVCHVIFLERKVGGRKRPLEFSAKRAGWTGK
jgi:hypothetical protein